MSDTALPQRQVTGLNYFHHLVTGRLKPGRLWLERNYRIKYFFRSIAYPRTTCKMMSALASEPLMQQILPIQHTLPSKIHRPYLYCGMPRIVRAQAIIDHYQFIKQLALPRMQTAMLTKQGIDLASFSGKNEESFVINLACTGRCEREGEVNLSISCNGTALAIITFAIMFQQGEKAIIIGGLQGAHRDTPHEAIREATKACHGLFPKRLLIETLMLFAAATCISKIQAVSDKGHIFRSLRYRLKKRRLFHAQYDEFWESLNAQRISSQLYQLPVTLPRKSLEDIASKKRAEARRRYELLDNLAASFRAQFS
ncbi:MAG: putative protein [Candidatus Erwinia impunctatus]|nr:putative protein [Culicoides impunctatus]